MSVQSKIVMARRAGYTLASAGATVAASLIGRNHRVRLIELSHHLGFTEGRPSLPVVPIEELLEGAMPPIRMIRPTAGRWEVSTYELAVLNLLVAWCAPREVFEFGTFDGRTTLNLLANAPEGAVIRTMDLPAAQQHLPPGKCAGTLIAEELVAGRIRQITGDSRTHDFSEFFGRQDFVFIDAGHSYECAAIDSASALRMTDGRRAVIVWHDYTTWPGVTRAVDELLDRNAGRRLARIAGTTMACLIRELG